MPSLATIEPIERQLAECFSMYPKGSVNVAFYLLLNTSSDVWTPFKPEEAGAFLKVQLNIGSVSYGMPTAGVVSLYDEAGRMCFGEREFSCTSDGLSIDHTINVILEEALDVWRMISY